MYNPHRDEPIVVGIDGSDQAVRAAEWATVEAVSRRVELHLVYVISKDELERRYAERVLAVAEAAAMRVDGSVKVESRMVRGPLVPTLRAQTESATALVLGSVGMGFIRRAMVGSTASALAAGAACPVVVVRGSDPDSAPPSAGPVLAGLGGHHIDDALLGSAMHEASIRGTQVLAVRAQMDLMPDLRRRRALRGRARVRRGDSRSCRTMAYDLSRDSRRHSGRPGHRCRVPDRVERECADDRRR